MFEGFKKFILRGNVLDLAVGVVIGAAFNGVVNSLVKGLITPLVGAVAKLPDFSKWQFTLRGSVFMVGDVINQVLSFVLVAAAVYFFVVLPVNKLTERMRKSKPEPESPIKICPECVSEIPKEAKRCKFCASVVA